jgi:circadian clock protein KaiC
LKAVIPKTLISGAPGTGKSILCLQFVYYGAKNNEPGLYITFEQSEKELIKNAKKVGLNLEPLIEKKKLKIMYINLGTFEQSLVDVDDLMNTIKDGVKEIKAKRLVIDSLSSVINIFTLSHLGKKMESDVVEIGDTKLIPLIINEKPIVRIIIWNTLNNLKKTGCICLATSELIEGQRGFSRDSISEFECDGIILLQHITSGGGANRTLNVIKMRETKIDDRIYPIEITDKGIILRKPEELYK